MLSGKNKILDEQLRAVILCGGHGSRMGDVTKSIPKTLVKIQNEPILWYSILKLYEVGFRKFIFPLGYKGSLIRQYVVQELSYLHYLMSLVDFAFLIVFV